MLSIDPRDSLLLAHERAGLLRAQAAPWHPGRALVGRRVVAACLRRAANRLDPVLLVHRAA